MSGIDLVTGGAGYFGSLLVKRLLADGRRVRVLDIHPLDDAAPGVEEVRADIRDAGAVHEACSGVSTVYHNVAQVPLAKDRAAFWSVNEGGTRNLLEACSRANVLKVVNTSSSAVFGAPERNPVDETMTPRPQEEYGRAKLAAEDLCREYAERGLDVTVIRPRTIMGHGRLGIMQILFEWVRNGRNIPVLGRGENLYQFVHADDLADACVRAAGRTGAELFHVGAERFGTMRETLEALAAHAGTGSRVVSVPFRPAVALMSLTARLGVSPLGPYHALMYGRSMYFDVSKARRLLGWSAKFGNVEMFCDSYDWYLAHRDEVLGRASGSLHSSPVKQGVLGLVSRILQVAR
ncbi:MAG: NAD-dependent epimerase/dehydratase family protein [Candidatus Binatia bacterium]